MKERASFQQEPVDKKKLIIDSVAKSKTQGVESFALEQVPDINMKLDLVLEKIKSINDDIKAVEEQIAQTKKESEAVMDQIPGFIQ